MSSFPEMFIDPDFVIKAALSLALFSMCVEVGTIRAMKMASKIPSKMC